MQQVQGGVHGRHDAGVHTQRRGLIHAEGSPVDDAEPVLQGIDPGQTQGGQFAQTVPGHSHRVDTQGHEVASHGIFHGEQGRLLPPGFLEIFLLIVEQQVQKVEVRGGGSPVHPFLDDGEGLVELPPHAGIVRPLPGKYQGEGQRWLIFRAQEDPLARPRLQRLGGDHAALGQRG